MLVAAVAHGQSASTAINVHIPFKFTVDQQQMLGDYKIRMNEDGLSSISMPTSEGKHYLRVITRLARFDSKQISGSRLVFDTVGDQKFLSEVWPPGTEDGYLVYAHQGKHGHEIVKVASAKL